MLVGVDKVPSTFLEVCIGNIGQQHIELQSELPGQMVRFAVACSGVYCSGL